MKTRTQTHIYTHTHTHTHTNKQTLKSKNCGLHRIYQSINHEMLRLIYQSLRPTSDKHVHIVRSLVVIFGLLLYQWRQQVSLLVLTELNESQIFTLTWRGHRRLTTRPITGSGGVEEWVVGKARQYGPV
jgi:hypothetical protein